MFDSDLIRSGTLLIDQGAMLPESISLQRDSSSSEWASVQSGSELIRLKTELASAGWNYFYMAAVNKTVLGNGSRQVSMAIEDLAASMRSNGCNSLQIDSITAHSLLGISYTKVSAHCCNMQKGVMFAARTGQKC